MNTAYAPQAAWFAYGTSSNSLTSTVPYGGSITSASGSFSAAVTGLRANTTYYYKAYMTVWDADSGKYVDIESSSIGTFTTLTEGTVTQGYLGCYEIPSVSISGTGTKGTYSDRDDIWYRYNTSSSSRKVVTHTVTSGNTRVRNYTTYFDADKHAPLWVAFPMHANVYGGSYTSSSDPWMSDQAITDGQQTGLDNAITVGYSRGHFTAASYRKVNQNAYYQTYYYTNQAPQWQNGFNSGVWSSMEQKILAASPSSASDSLYVVVGVLYEGTTQTLPSGSIYVPIPSHFYCCVMKCSFSSGAMTTASGEAFIYTNESHTGETYNSSDFVTTIDAIEQRAGFDFFANVPTSLQTKAENGTSALSL